MIFELTRRKFLETSLKTPEGPLPRRRMTLQTNNSQGKVAIGENPPRTYLMGHKLKLFSLGALPLSRLKMRLPQQLPMLL